MAQNVAFSPLGDVPANIVSARGRERQRHLEVQRRQNVPVPIACNYHPWESAYILPRDNPYVAISGAGRHVPHRQAAGGQAGVPGLARAGRLPGHARVAQGAVRADDRPGVNDLGTIKLSPGLFEKKS